MTGPWLNILLGAALLIAASTTGHAAPSECVLCGVTPGDGGSTDVTAPLEIELETTLDFDRVIMGGDRGGGVQLLPDGSNASSGAVEPLSGRARIGRIVIHGEPGRSIYVDFPKSLELIGIKGEVVSVTSVVTDLPDNPRLDGRGELTVEFGGDLKVSGSADGDFRGNLLVRADYL